MNKISNNKIFYIMGKSASGKDSIYRHLLEESGLGLRKLMVYTTRPIRSGEEYGKEYYFVDEKRFLQLKSQGRVVEFRTYQTVYGPWIYFTADDGNMDLSCHSYLGIGTLESYKELRSYYGEGTVRPIYVEVEDGERLQRALIRERREKSPRYQEMCRRFLADSEDFSEEKVAQAGILRRFVNVKFAECVREIVSYIREQSESGCEGDLS